MNPTPTQPSTVRKARILIADDEENIRAIMKEVLERVGYEVIVSAEGGSVLTLAQQHQPDLILLDLAMPGVTGYQVLRQLRADPRTHNVRIIVVSGLDTTEAFEESMIAGADDFLRKPFPAVELLARVRSMLRVSSIPETSKRVEEYLHQLQAMRKPGAS